MPFLHRHLRACTVLWLLGQTLSLAALVPTDCCSAHHVGTAGVTPECHQAASESSVCPMHTSAGDDCPMHAASGSTAQAELCVMVGLCNAPASALAMLITVPGVLAVTPTARYVETSVPLSVAAPPTVERPFTHDPPPPRA